MNDYISRKAVLHLIREELPLGTWKNSSLDKAIKAMGKQCEAIEAIPAEDVKPVVHGTWIIYNELVKNELLDENEVLACSACREQKTKRKYNFCPNCGADMREEKNEQIHNAL